MENRIWLYGAGSVGSALGALLYGKIPVTLVGSSPHAAKVRADGLAVALGREEPTVVPLPVCRPEEMPALGPADIVLVTCKIRSLPEAARVLRPRLAPGTAVVALQNGMGFEAEFTAQLAHPLERGIVQFGANSDGAGNVRYYPGRLLLSPGAAAAVLLPLLAGTPVQASIEADFARVMWNKLTINGVANALAGILRSSNRGLASEALNPVKEGIIREIKAVAAAEGVELNVSVEELNRYLSTENIPSLVRDLNRKLPTEIDWINGAVVRRGEAHGIAAPVNASLVAMVKYLETQY